MQTRGALGGIFEREEIEMNKAIPKLHWTQTPEGKKKLRKALKKHWQTRRSKASDDKALITFRRSATGEREVLGISADPFEKQMVIWNGWEILAEDTEQNCLIVKVPLGKD